MSTAGVQAASPAPEPSSPGTITREQWELYRQRFVDRSGRIIDDANKGISHSEGQGFGLLLAYLAGDRSAFMQIWTFTRIELLLRDDGLVAWRWDPDAKPHVTDINDASDGDLLIAYALALAGKNWDNPQFTVAAKDLAGAIGKRLVVERDDRNLLMPGAAGFGEPDRPDGPVVNLSYWVYEALPVMAELAPGTDWEKLSTSGRALLAQARFGPAGLPADWVSARSERLEPAKGFPQQFGYDGLRIPLYLLRAGYADRALLAPFAQVWGGESGRVAVVALSDGQPIENLADPGYQMLAATLACVLDRKPIPTALRVFRPTSYYPSTIHLLALSLVAQRHRECL
ncbi:MAG: endoglucanase [Methylobacteriaceae bacterium]|nr:endoglucanase [Methylobacteriaceae bacterium]